MLPDKCSVTEKGKQCVNPPEFIVSIISDKDEYIPEDFATEVIMRMLRMETVQKDILDDVELTLRKEFMSNLAHTTRRDPHEQMADIFNNFDRSSEARFMQALEERDRESSEHIKSLMFTFEDLNRLDPTGVQTLMRYVDKDKLAVALKSGSEELRNLFFSNMSERAAKILREDMDAMGCVEPFWDQHI